LFPDETRDIPSKADVSSFPSETTRKHLEFKKRKEDYCALHCVLIIMHYKPTLFKRFHGALSDRFDSSE
jgi:hypothetical protein